MGVSDWVCIEPLRLQRRLALVRYRSKNFSTVEDPITIIYSDTPDLSTREGRVLRTYLEGLKHFIELHLSEESVFIAYWQVEHAGTYCSLTTGV